MQKIRVGVVGTGYLGRHHARVLADLPEVELVGFVDPDDTKAQEVSESLKVKRFATLQELEPRIDAAVVATPTTTHAQVAESLLRAGKDVLIEKPITDDPASARRLIEVANETGRLIQVGHVERYNPAIMAITSRLDSPRYVEADRLGIFSGRSLDIDVLLDLMIHDLHLVLSLLQRPVVDVRAVGVPVLTDRVDMANVRLQLDNGSVANLTASRVSSERVRKFRVFGHDSYFSVDTKEQEVKGFQLVGEGRARSIRPLDIPIEKKEPLRAELESFVQCVRTRSRPLVPAEDGLAALELALRVGKAIDESLRPWRS
jgi:predicted dehydrogenase